MAKKICIFILTVMGVLPVALANSSEFDTPLKVERVNLGESPYSPGMDQFVNCYYFKSFMVKEVDLREKGAEQLSILPVNNMHKPPICQKNNISEEKVIKNWNGYFKGVKEQYVFFRADDGINRGIGMVIFDGKQGQKIFSDSIDGNFQNIKMNGSELLLEYRRVYSASCSLLADRKICWKKITKDTGLKKSDIPDCTSSYKKSKVPHDNPSVIAYNIDVVIRDDKSDSKVVKGQVLCWPAD